MKLKALMGVMLIALTSAFSPQAPVVITGQVQSESGTALAMATITHTLSKRAVSTDQAGKFTLEIPALKGKLIIAAAGYQSQTIQLGTQTQFTISLISSGKKTHDSIKAAEITEDKKIRIRGVASPQVASGYVMRYDEQEIEHNTEEYKGIEENIFHQVTNKPLSTFSIDVDKASYSILRRFIQQGQLPPVNSVRVEEMINYFDYQYEGPTNSDPLRIHTEMIPAPWNPTHKLLSVGLQARKMNVENLPPSNLVFLIDVSGSMATANKLPLVKSSLKMLTEQLRPNDYVSLVVYAGAAGVVLEPTPGNRKNEIMQAIDQLEAGGSTAGGEGIRLAYALAQKHFRKEGNNRVILATDGDFNIGESSDAAMEELVASKRQTGIFLTVLGYGMGNYKDSKMEVLADKGNGNYAYIDNLNEARKTLVSEFGGTLFTLAKDVKIQIEFNPEHVQSYRLIGYENRKLNDEDFNNDKKDAGELGSGHTVTALYEIVPANGSTSATIDPLKYQARQVSGKGSAEVATIKVRYKTPEGEVSKLIVHPILAGKGSEGSENIRWAGAVASFGMLVRKSEFLNDYSADQVLAMAIGAKGADINGYRAEFINLVRSYKELVKSNR